MEVTGISSHETPSRLYKVATDAAVSPGVRVTRAETSIGSVDLFQFADYRHAFPRHSHERLTIGVFGEGNGSIRFRNGAWHAMSGSILAIAADETHSAEPLRGGGWTYRTFYPSDEFVRHAFGVVDSELKFTMPIIDDASLSQRLLHLHVALEQRAPTLEIDVRIIDTFRQVGRQYGCADGAKRVKSAPDSIARARSFIDVNFCRAISLTELSAVAELSPFHFVRSFRKTVGIPPHAYLTQARANRARDLLLTGETVSGTAFRCGFSDQSHLTRVFKRIFGITPGAYVSGVAGRAGRRSTV